MKSHPLLWMLCVLLALPACGEEAAPEAPEETIFRVKTEISQTESLANEIITSAVVETKNWQPLYFESGGVVKRVHVKENQQVSAGALLASLDNDSQDLSVQKAELSLEQAKLNEQQAAHKLDQTRALIETGGASPEDVYDREQRYIEAQVKVRQAELQLQSQKVKLGGTSIKAPFSGMVSEVNIRVGEMVHGDVADPDRDMNRRPPMVMVQPGSGMVIRAQLPEGRATEIQGGTLARVVLMEHRDVELTGLVERVSSTVDRETRTVHVLLELKEPAGGWPPSLRDGATALVTFLTDVRSGAVTVSERALFYFQDAVYVFAVQEDKTVRRLPVEKGVMRNGRVEVVSGLDEGVVVSRSHLYLLRDGQTVNPQPQGAPMGAAEEAGQ